MFKNKTNINSKFYLTNKTFNKSKPKFVTLELAKLLKHDLNNKNNVKNFIDIGCANGVLIDFFKTISNNINFIGTEIENDFVTHCQNNISNARFYLDDLSKKPNKSMPLGDIIYLSGVHSHFEDPEIYINGCISRSNKKSKIIIHGLFNPYNINMLIKYKKSDDYDLKKKLIDQTGWNMFSINTMKLLLNKNDKIKNFKFVKIVFPKNLNVKKNSTNHIRSWTQKFIDGNYFINGLNFIQHQYFLIINLK